nr:PREDICTED: uncharacterized protein LOC109034218 isoform X1 [Bemisia tabaci]
MASLLFISSKHTSRGICLLSQFAKRSLQPSARLHLKGRQLLLCSRCFNASNGSRKLAAISRRSFEGVKYFRTSSIFYEEQVVNVPPFAESVSEGDIRWEKNVGDEVATDEVVCEIETDKTSVPVPSPGNGVILERYVDDGASVKAGQKLFKINITGTAPSKAAAPKAEAPAAPPPPKVEAAAPPPPPPPPPSQQAAAPATPPPPPAAAPAAKPIPVAAIRHAQLNVDDTVTRWKVGELFQSPPEAHTFHVEKESDTETQTLKLHLPEDIRALIKLMEDHPEVPLLELACQIWPESKEHTNTNLLYTRILKALRLKFAIDYVDKPKEFWHQTVWCSRKVFHYDGLKRRWRSRGWHRLTPAKVDPENFGGKYDDVIDVTMGFWVSIWAGGTVSIVPSVNFVAADYIKVLKNELLPKTSKIFGPGKQFNLVQHNSNYKTNTIKVKNKVSAAKRLSDWFSLHPHINVLPVPAWSTDLNPAEDLWDEVFTLLDDSANCIDDLSDIKDFQAFVRKMWRYLNTKHQTFRDVADSMPFRLTCVIQAHGSSTKDINMLHSLFEKK